MESRSFWHGCSYCFQVIAIAVVSVAIFSGYASAQGAPSVGQLHLSDFKGEVFRGDGRMNVHSNIDPGQESLVSSGTGNPEIAPSDSQSNRKVRSVGQLHFSDLKAGIFWGGGMMNVDRDTAPGPLHAGFFWGIPPAPAFSGFRHHTSTRLDDVFVAGEWGFRWGDMLLGTTSLDTNIGRQNRFKQKSTASPGQTGFGYNTTLGVLRLPDNAEGLITLDNKNRIFNVDQCFAFPKEIALSASPAIPKLRFLAGWKFSRISSEIDPYFAAHAPLVRETLPGQIGWENLWRNAIPFTTSFRMAQRFWWTGPYLGMRLTAGTPQKLPGQWHVEGKGAPYAWGRYKFAWEAAYNDGFFFVRGQQSTNERVDGYFLEVKGGTQIKLVGDLFLEIWSKYRYLHMDGSGSELQTAQNNFLAAQTFSQEAAQRISIRENFWGAGVNLVLHL